ncbi:nucleotide exchange factor GrpE [Luteibacter rhizovicinus DSM 16549]|uniref:Protein GrpE n=1 Tax=Luteibacter rhizovicinus DSM 16549 TaxID=1440763 RepID=A0A0G9HF06_9GAMM|nr:nucleotide exchange factor GrpE [Luteibacter rhizovicinus]APG06080.1 nucleotide exchange factor GrpE [Luteibacter rhizovicinus DSM 16549]KLD68273.1 heat shock protein GrpE [Luteibacter rhizovicinus DSM 16549]KLD78662.1 heat shock protein GrpE [Xanthomonas hyacinthi DSM 19077]
MQNNDPHAPDPAQDGAADSAIQAELDALGVQLATMEAELAQARETVLREKAEIENQRRRMQRDVDQARRFANEKLLAELLPVYDGIALGLTNEAADAKTLREGLQMSLDQLKKVTEANGLTMVDPLHQPFNPEHHQAISSVESNEHAPNTVVAVVQKGFVLNDRLLRPALVAVVRDH